MNTNEQLVIEQAILQAESLYNEIITKLDDIIPQIKRFESLKSLDKFYPPELNVIETTSNNSRDKFDRLKMILNSFCQEIDSVENSNINSIESISTQESFDEAKILGDITLDVEPYTPTSNTTTSTANSISASAANETKQVNAEPEITVNKVELKSMESSNTETDKKESDKKDELDNSKIEEVILNKIGPEKEAENTELGKIETEKIELDKTEASAVSKTTPIQVMIETKPPETKPTITFDSKSFEEVVASSSSSSSGSGSSSSSSSSSSKTSTTSSSTSKSTTSSSTSKTTTTPSTSKSTATSSSSGVDFFSSTSNTSKTSGNSILGSVTGKIEQSSGKTSIVGDLTKKLLEGFKK